MTLTRTGAGATAVKAGKNKPTLYGNGDTVHLFRSVAKYFEPAGAVSWDVSMTATPQNWRVNVNKATPCASRRPTTRANASWYEGMGIMVAYMADGHYGVDPYKKKVDVKGVLTHGHLPRTTTTAARRAPCPTRARSRAPARCPASSTSTTSSTARVT